jgi:hypothetical protein
VERKVYHSYSSLVFLAVVINPQFIGEAVLIQFLLNNSNFRVRAAAAFALGQPIFKHPEYLKVNITINLEQSALKELPIYVANEDDIVAVEWDSKEFASYVFTAMTEGRISNVVDSETGGEASAPEKQPYSTMAMEVCKCY